MPIRLVPDPEPGVARAVVSLLENDGLLTAEAGGSTTAWRRAALREGIARDQGRPRRSAGGREAYVAAPSPRSTRGATRA